jgi:probable addiction module antidote protein
MKKVVFDDWDLADSLETEDDIVAHIKVALAENDTAFLFKTMDALSRAKGMTRIAKELGVTREGLYKSLSSDGNPSFETVLKLFGILGLKLMVQKAS